MHRFWILEPSSFCSTINFFQNWNKNLRKSSFSDPPSFCFYLVTLELRRGAAEKSKQKQQNFVFFFWKSNFTNLMISQDFLYGFEKVDSAAKTRGSDGSEFVHDLVLTLGKRYQLIPRSTNFLWMTKPYTNSWQTSKISLNLGFFYIRNWYHNFQNWSKVVLCQ